MTKPSTLHRRRTYPRALYCSGRSQRTGTHAFRRTKSWRTYGLVALMLSGLLLSVGVVLGKALLRGKRPAPCLRSCSRPVSFSSRRTRCRPSCSGSPSVKAVASILRRIGKVVRGKRNPQDTGLFQINAVVWAKKAEELGYNIHTPEGNEQMAHYIFENYGSAPWQSSAKCWGRVS